MLLKGCSPFNSAPAVGSRGFSSRFLYEVSVLDPASLVLTGVLMTGATLLACWMPARRTTRLEPVEALRIE